MNATATKSRKTRKLTEVHGICRWVGGSATQGQLDNGDAILSITATGKETQFYFVESNRDDEGLLYGYRLVKIDALNATATYDLECTDNGFRCDCPDATYSDRPGGCKHAKGLAAALKAAKLA